MGESKILKAGIIFTKNLGNYESLKIDCGMEIPLKDGVDYDKAFDLVYQTLENVVVKEVGAFQERCKGRV